MKIFTDHVCSYLMFVSYRLILSRLTLIVSRLTLSSYPVSSSSRYTMRDKRPVKFAAIACDVHGAACGEHHVQSYPTMKLYNFIAEDENDRVVSSRPSELRTKLDQALEKLPNGGKIPGSSKTSTQTLSTDTLSTALTAKPVSPNTEYNPVTKDASGNVMFGKWKFSGEPALSLNKRLHDAAVGLVYGLKITTFLKAEKGVHLSAKIWKSLQSWLEFVSLTFPRATFRDDLVALLRDMQVSGGFILLKKMYLCCLMRHQIYFFSLPKDKS